MQDIRLIAMDMDGTLLGSTRGVIPPVNLCALRDARARGIQLCLASGRAPDDVSFHALDAELDVHVIALNGSVMLDKPLGCITCSSALPEATARRIYQLVNETNLPCAVFSEHTVALSCPESYSGVPKATWGTFMAREGGRTMVTDDPSALERALAHVSKFVVTAYTEPEQLLPLKAALEADFPEAEVTSSGEGNIEINPARVNKGSALRMLARQLNIPMAQVMAIGDHDNDVSMLAAAGIGVAMGNATPGALAAARYRTLPCLENGVAAAIRALALGEEISGVEPIK